MSLIDVQRSTWEFYPAPPFQNNVTPTISGFALTGAGMKVAFIFPCGAYKSSLTIDSIEFLVSAFSSSGNVDVRVETVDTTTGFPTGTLFAANTNGTHTISGTGIQRKFITADAEVDGTPFAIVIAWASGSYTIGYRLNSYQTKAPYVGLHNGSSYSDADGMCMVALRKSGGIEPVAPQPGIGILSAINAVNVNTGSTPDECGNRILLTTPIQISGLWWYGHPAGDYDAVIYNNADEVLASRSVESNMVSGASPGLNLVYFAPTLPAFAKDSPFRAVIKPTSGSNVTIYEFDMVLPERLDAWEGGGYGSDGIIKTTRTDAGAWTNDSAKRNLLGLILSQHDAGGVATSYARLVNGL